MPQPMVTACAPMRQLQKRGDRAGGEAAVLGLLKADHHRFGNCDAELDGHARGGGYLQLARPRAQAAYPRQQRRARHLAAAGDDQELAAIVLVAVFGMVGEREAAEEVAVEPLEPAHRAATMASGSEVIGASSSISGAAKL